MVVISQSELIRITARRQILTQNINHHNIIIILSIRSKIGKGTLSLNTSSAAIQQSLRQEYRQFKPRNFGPNTSACLNF